MTTTFLQKVRHGLLVLVAAMILAVATTMAPAVLDEMAGTSLTAHVYACQPPGGGCG